MREYQVGFRVVVGNRASKFFYLYVVVASGNIFEDESAGDKIAF